MSIIVDNSVEAEYKYIKERYKDSKREYKIRKRQMIKHRTKELWKDPIGKETLIAGSSTIVLCVVFYTIFIIVGISKLV